MPSVWTLWGHSEYLRMLFRNNFLLCFEVFPGQTTDSIVHLFTHLLKQKPVLGGGRQDIPTLSTAAKRSLVCRSKPFILHVTPLLLSEKQRQTTAVCAVPLAFCLCAEKGSTQYWSEKRIRYSLITDHCPHKCLYDAVVGADLTLAWRYHRLSLSSFWFILNKLIPYVLSVLLNYWGKQLHK